MILDPIFVVGCPRSGTSVTGWTVAQHEDYITGAESHFLYYLLRREGGPRAPYPSRLHEAYAASRTGDSWLDRMEVGLDEFALAAGKGFADLFASRCDGKTWVDSSPEHVLVTSGLAAMFPRAKFIHVVRDARSVCRSMLSSGFNSPWATDLGAACKTWNHYVGAGVAAEAALAGRMIRIRQEALKDDPDHTTAALFDFLELERPAGVVEFLGHNTINSSYDRRSQLGGAPTPEAASAVQSAPPSEPTPTTLSLWRPEMKTEVEAACGPLMRQLGYL